MATTFGFYADAGLTVPLASLPLSISTAGGSAEGEVHFGSTNAAKTLSRDGGATIFVNVADSAGGSGLATTVVRLALSAPNLDSATPGAAVAIGTTRPGGASNSIAVHYRVTLAAPPRPRG